MRNGLKWDHHALFPSYLERTLKSVRFCTFHISVSLSLSHDQPLCSALGLRGVFASSSPSSSLVRCHFSSRVPTQSTAALTVKFTFHMCQWDVDGGGGVEWARFVSSFPRSPLTFTSAGQGRGWPQQTVQRMFLKLSYSIRNGMECKGLVDCGYHHDGNLEQCRYFQIRPSHRGHTAGDIAVHFKLSAFVTHPHLRTMCAQGPKS